MEHLSEIISFIVGLASGWTLKIYVGNRSNTTSQHRNKVDGDMAGRDINKR